MVGPGMDWTGLGMMGDGTVRFGSGGGVKESGKPTQDWELDGIGWTDERVDQQESHDDDFGDNRGNTEQSALDGEFS